MTKSNKINCIDSKKIYIKGRSYYAHSKNRPTYTNNQYKRYETLFNKILSRKKGLMCHLGI